MNGRDREYGGIASIGVTVPQANPVVEPEFQALAPAGVSLLASRLQGSRTDSKNRLVGYLENFEETLQAYDTATLDAVAFACTGVSYIVGQDYCESELRRLSDRFGYPILSAASAIEQALHHIGASRIAVFAPYPEWLSDLGFAYWRTRGFDVVASAYAPLDPSDTRSVYKIRSRDIPARIAELDLGDADALLMSGTGMPTLRAIPALCKSLGKPVLSSNLCLAWATLRICGADLPAPTSGEPLFGGWTQRLADA